MANGDDRQAFNESLIDAIETEACLWDLRNKQYKNRPICDAARPRVAKALAVTVAEVKAQWKSLRDTFRRALKELNRAMKSSAPAGDDLDEATQRIFFKRLLFLKNTIEGRPMIRDIIEIMTSRFPRQALRPDSASEDKLLSFLT
ncbi:hypothetical protein HPB50_017133 [Hyalomma asiaticum]|uniref:Uncharacterized protein n=1 Tax=Hyalomma asiaticum TaxID=266040 RepID=A0ACB7SNJ3_HYAAI|nr:hypothetical protein HPB50_017133 [Hyalomma asiaticum]